MKLKSSFNVNIFLILFQNFLFFPAQTLPILTFRQPPFSLFLGIYLPYILSPLTLFTNQPDSIQDVHTYFQFSPLGRGGAFFHTFLFFSGGRNQHGCKPWGHISHLPHTQLDRPDTYTHSFRRLRQPSRGAYSFLRVFCFPIIINIKNHPPSPAPNQKKTSSRGGGSHA